MMVVSPQNNFAEILQERLASRARRHASSCPSIGWWFTDWARPHPVHCTQHSTGLPSHPQASRKTSSCKYVEDHEVRVRCRPVGVRIRGTLPCWACGQCAASAAHAVPTVAAVTRLSRPHLTSCLAVPPLSYAILQANVSATYVQVCATALAGVPRCVWRATERRALGRLRAKVEALPHQACASCGACMRMCVCTVRRRARTPCGTTMPLTYVAVACGQMRRGRHSSVRAVADRVLWC